MKRILVLVGAGLTILFAIVASVAGNATSQTEVSLTPDPFDYLPYITRVEAPPTRVETEVLDVTPTSNSAPASTPTPPG